MGRGRAKAIQKKIARDLKYSSGGTDLERLRAELASGASEHPSEDGQAGEDDDEIDPYAADDDE